MGITNVVLTVTDVLGLSSTCAAIVTVVDATVPTITCPANITGNNDPGPHGPCDPGSPGGGGSCPKDGGDCKGLAVSRVHLMLVSLNINDEPVGYAPPVGPPVKFMVRYNQRDMGQPGNFLYSNLGPKWTFDWLSVM